MTLRDYLSGKKAAGYAYLSTKCPGYKMVTDDGKYYGVCPKCGSNEVEHLNWYEAKEFGADLLYKCNVCSSSGDVGNLVLRTIQGASK